MTPSPSFRPFLLAGASLPMLLAMRVSSAGAPPQANKPAAGEALFAARCASCHGPKGIGGPGYQKALVGTRSLDQLAAFIGKSMPPGGGTPVPEAHRIAAYMLAAFYSPNARAKNVAPRVELTRLTVRQFRNAVADLLSGFHAGPTGGLRGEYFKGRDIGKDRVVERVDPEVRFDFGTEGPVPGKFDPHNFSAVWSGSLLAPDTGDYDLIVQSDQAVRLWFDGATLPLVDGWVKSGKDSEFVAPVTLLGGRAYPLRLEFSKATQGVNDDAKRKGTPAPPAFVRLLWRRPKRVPEPIPGRDLLPADSPSTYVVASAFPADDRSMGFERGVDESKEWDDATTTAALHAAAYAVTHTGVPDNAPDRPSRLKAYAKYFVERAFRRPLTPDVQTLYVDHQFEVAKDPDTAVKRVVLLALKSPRFLVREIGPRDPWTVASNLAFALWDGLPDDELRAAAARGDLATPSGVEKQAARMVADPRAWTKLRDFLLLWLKVDDVPEIVKSTKRYPDFDPAVAADLRTSMELFLQDAGWDYRKLMTSSKVFFNGRLSKLYGGGLAPDAPFQAVEDKERAGVLAQPYLLARLGYLDGSDPIHRGVLIVRNMLGRVLAPPPMAFAPLAASAHPEFTTRERVAFQTKPAMCNGCHGLINPLGFTFERYDAIGRVRGVDNGKPVDDAGYYVAPSGSKIAFKGPGDLARYLAEGDESHTAFVEKLFLNMVHQSPAAYGPQTISNLKRSFEKNGLDVRDLMASIAVAASGAK